MRGRPRIYPTLEERWDKPLTEAERNRQRKQDARQRVFKALQSGRLLKGPCEQQGDGCKGEVQAHHDDYTKPLDVTWLCEAHHRRRHTVSRGAS